MKTRFVVLFAALALTIFAPNGAQAVGVGKTCGGIGGLPCDAGLFCQQRPGQCRIADATGTCTRVPQICNKDFRPVCGCNNMTYGNDCERQRAMASKLHDGACK